MAEDDVQLTDLRVIQRYSLVRGATASRAELVAALQADLDWLRGGRRPAAVSGAPDRQTPTKPAPAQQAPSKRAASRRAPVKRATKA